MKYLIFPLILLVSGCSHYNYRARQLDLACTDLLENVQEGFESGSVCAGDYPGEAWWTFFQDPQLDRLIELSLISNPSIKIAQSRILLAREEALDARSALFPHFSLYGDIAREKLSLYSNESFGIQALEYVPDGTLYLNSALFELDIWNKNRNTYYAALNELFATAADYAEARLVLSTTIASVYFDLQYNLELERIARRRLEAREDLNALLQQRFDNGVISAFDLYENGIEIQRIKDYLIQQQGVVEIDRHALAALVGNVTCGWGELCVEPAAIFTSPLPLPCTLPIDLLGRRPDINAQRLRIEASCFQVAVAKARFFPQIDLMGFIGFTSFQLAKFFTIGAFSWDADASSTLPLFTGMQLEARLGAARERVEIDVETYNQLVLNAIQQVSDALTKLITADGRLAALSGAVQDAQTLYKLTDQRFQHAVDDRLAVLNALENLLLQEQFRAGVGLDRFQAALSLIQSIGGGYYDNSTE